MTPIKQLICDLASQQKELKNQRKTVHLVGERKVQPWVARDCHATNRWNLRVLYIAYAILRGKDPKLAVSTYEPTSWEGKQVENTVEKYIADFTREAVRID